MSRMKTISSIGVLAVMLSACGGDGADSGVFTVRDSAGIRIVENVSPAWNDADEWRLSDLPLVDIGGLEGDPRYELYRVSNAVKLPNGHIVIANSGSNEIRFYDESGVHLLDAGGEGEGPGEFLYVSWVSGFRGDSVAAYDSRQMRMSIFDSAGNFGRTFPVRGMDADGRGRAYGVFENGSVFVGAVPMGPPDEDGGAFRHEEPLYTVTPEGEAEDSLHASPGDEAFMYSAGSAGTGNSLVFFGAPMFGRFTEYAIHGNQFYVAANDTYEVRVHGLDGSLMTIVRRDHDFMEVTDADIDELRERQLGGDTPPGMRQMMVDVLDATPIRETMPAYQGVVVDRIGNLWVEEYRRPTDSVRRWTVFSVEGVMLGTMTVPDRFAVHDVGDDYVLGEWTDEMEIEHVQIYELIKP